MRITRSGALAALGLALAACGPDGGDQPLAPDTESSPTLAAVEDGPYAGADHRRHRGRACGDRKHRQFDFWVGKWNVQNPAGAIGSTSVITRELDGCVVMENFIANNGYQGRSLNIYDERDGRWYQSFVDNTTGNYRLTGGLQGRDMVMNADQTAFLPGVGVFQRTSVVTWSPLAGGRVRQVFDESFNGGPVTRTFDGLYLPTPSPDRATPNDPGFCRTTIPGARQLDFWIGDWKVSSKHGHRFGRSAVTSDLAGCLIEENFSSKHGLRSRSFLFYDFTADRWFATYADNTGEHYELSGGLEGAKMVLTGDERLRRGKTVRIRATLEPADGGVKQRVELSRDGGTRWKTISVLTYARAQR
jgi:hypothetical protein